jgi:hypothetical protein
MEEIINFYNTGDYIMYNTNLEEIVAEEITTQDKTTQERGFNEIYITNPIFEPIFSKLNKNTTSEKVNKKIKDILYCLLGEKKIDYKSTRKFMFDGIPDEYPGLRSILWKLLLNYLPSDVNEWQSYIIEKRKDYEFLKADLIIETDDLSIKQIQDEISKDIRRTKTHMHFFSMQSKENPNETNADVMGRILYIFALLHPDVKYVQGMNEILSPIYYCFSNDPNTFFSNKIEADAFYCFENLMLEIKEIFIKEKDNTANGIHAKIGYIGKLLEFIDKELSDHFKIQHCEIEYFAFRWYTLLFTQEFNMPDILRIWDSIIIYDNKFQFLAFLCLSIIVMNRDRLINKDFSNIMFVLQNLELLDIDVEKLVINASDAQNNFADLVK